MFPESQKSYLCKYWMIKQLEFFSVFLITKFLGAKIFISSDAASKWRCIGFIEKYLHVSDTFPAEGTRLLYLKSSELISTYTIQNNDIYWPLNFELYHRFKYCYPQYFVQSSSSLERLKCDCNEQMLIYWTTQPFSYLLYHLKRNEMLQTLGMVIINVFQPRTSCIIN